MKPPAHLFNAILLILLLQSTGASAQDISFHRVDMPDVNIEDIITGITQDLQGNIWFVSTSSGLFEYDGIHLKSYKLDPYFRECMYADKRGNLWIGTWGGGLEKMEPSTGVFIHYKHDPKDSTSISGDTVTCILQDHEGMLWIGTRQAGLNRFDPKTGKFIQYMHSDHDSTSLSFDQVRALYEDREGTLWVGTGSFFYRTITPIKKVALTASTKMQAHLPGIYTATLIRIL
jgi:ligand-binding sensor domain-containing protein